MAPLIPESNGADKGVNYLDDPNNEKTRKKVLKIRAGKRRFGGSKIARLLRQLLMYAILMHFVR